MWLDCQCEQSIHSYTVKDIIAGLQCRNPGTTNAHLRVQRCKKIGHWSTEMWYGQMSHSLYTRQGAKYMFDTHIKMKRTCLNDWVLLWGGVLALILCEKYFAFMLWIHLSSLSEGSLQSSSKLFWMFTFVLWCNVSILMRVDQWYCTRAHKNSLNGCTSTLKLPQ